MKVSILMPVKNAMPYLKECIASIVGQSTTGWQLIAVDDHSTDDSWEYLRQAAATDRRIIVSQNLGSGIIDALRQAYKASTGAYITRMDADDIMATDRLAVMSSQLEAHGDGHITLGQVAYFAEGGVGDGYKRYEQWLNGLIATGTCWQDLYRECVIPSPCWMVSRADFDQCSGFDIDTYPEDYDLCFRFYKAGLQCIPTEHVLHQWRDYGTRTSRTDENYADNRFLALKCNYFEELHHDPSRELVLWGAGKKGKSIAKLLLEKEIRFRWLCNNDQKIGRDIYGVILESVAQLPEIENPQIIISVANPEEQLKITNQLKDNSKKSIEDYFCFC